MPKKTDTRLYGSEVMALPAFKVVLGEVPSPNPEGWRKERKAHKAARASKTTVQRLIVHLEKKL